MSPGHVRGGFQGTQAASLFGRRAIVDLQVALQRSELSWLGWFDGNSGVFCPCITESPECWSASLPLQICTDAIPTTRLVVTSSPSRCSHSQSQNKSSENGPLAARPKAEAPSQKR